MRRRLWNRARAGLSAGFGQLESLTARRTTTSTAKRRARNTPALRAEPLEPRLVLAPVVAVDNIFTDDSTPEITGTIDDPTAIISAVTIHGKTYETAVNHGDGTWALPDDTINPPLLHGFYDVTVKVNDEVPITASGALEVNLRQIVINEILFHPFSTGREPTEEEFIELYNNSDIDVDVRGWQFTSGLSFTIPQQTAGASPQDTIIPAGGYLVVAADVGEFTAKYGSAALLVGGDGSGNELTDWIGTLSNSGENIRLETAAGDLVDRVRYADSGDWAVRRETTDHGPNGGSRLGWEWIAPHDDLGHSLELRNPDLTNREGQNWAPSAARLGTPGKVNSAASDNIPPMLLDVEHSPAIPATDQEVLVTTRVVNEIPTGFEVKLHYRVNPTLSKPFVEAAMTDDGLNGDVAAGDGVFSATILGQANLTIVDFYVEASENGGANVRSYPSPSDDAGNHKANLLYQVDDMFSEDFGAIWPLEQPIYRLVMTAAGNNTLQNTTGRNNDQRNATFIVHDPSRGTKIDNGDLASFNLDDETVSILFNENLFADNENIDAVHVRENGHIILSTEANATLGGLTFRDGDLVQYDPTSDTAQLIFSEDAFGSNEDIDAIWVKESGGRITELILSTRGKFTVAGIDGDVEYLNGDLVKIDVGAADLNATPLVSFAGVTVSRAFSESLFGGGADIDAVHLLNNGHFLLSTTGSEQLAGLAFTNGAIVQFDPNDSDPGAGIPGNSSASVFFAESNFSDGNEDLDAIFVEEELDDDLLVLSTEGGAELGSATEIFYNVGVRIRGNGSRGGTPLNFRVAFPSDHRFDGESSIPLNIRDSFSQLLGMTIYQDAGLSAETPVKAVQVRLNGGRATDATAIGTSYVQLQARDGNLPAANYPLDDGGNLYSMNDRGGCSGNLAFAANPNTFRGSTCYLKQTNTSADDWSDLVEITRALDRAQTPDDVFIEKVSQAINVSEWLRHMAVMALIRNEEGGYASGRGDDYSIYRGQFDTRFDLVPHDLDSIFNWGSNAQGNEAPIIEKRQGTAFAALFRVIEFPAFAPIFYGHLEDLMENVFNPERLNPIIDELFGEGTVERINDWVSTTTINHFKGFVRARVTFVKREIANLPRVSPHDLSQLPDEYQSLADQQRFLRISEIMYNPRGEDLEFVELINMGGADLDLTGVHFKGGILFGFNHGAPIESAVPQTPETILGPGERVLVVKDRAAFLAHYDPDGSKKLDDKIAGEFWNGRLSNAGERILLEGRLGEPILDFSYKDGWYDQTDGDGFSLVLREGIEADTDRSAWGQKSSWRASGFIGGSPGVEEPSRSYNPDSIRINEILSHTDAADNGDWVELHNTTEAAIDIGGWYLSDSGNNLRKFRIPDGTVIPGGGFIMFDQFDEFGLGGGFGLNVADPMSNPLGDPGAFGLSELGDTLRLSSVDPDDVRENIDAVHVMPGGNIVLSTTGTAILGNNAFSFRNGDLVEYDPTSGDVTLLFSELFFAGAAENIDAVSMLDNGNLILSTGGPATLPAADGGTLSFGNGDLVMWDRDNQVATLAFSETLFDAEPGDLVANENIDAVHALGDGKFIISTSGPAGLGGQLFDDGDLILIKPGAGSDFAKGIRGDAIISRYFSEALFAPKPLDTMPDESNTVVTENIDAVFVGADGRLVLSAVSSFSLVTPLSSPIVLFDNGDLAQITPGANANLGGDPLDPLNLPSFGDGAEVSLLLEEDPVDPEQVTFYGEAAGYRESANFGAAEKEVTFGIHEKSDIATDSTDFVAQQGSGTRGRENDLPQVGPVVINEIMYNPAGDATPIFDGDDVEIIGIEFIELFNVTGVEQDLTGWTISSAFNYAFPDGTKIPAGTLLDGRGYLILVSDEPAKFRADFDVPAEVDILAYNGRLDNGGESIRLNKPGTPEPITDFVPAILVDRVKYDDELPWPVEADGIVLPGTGRSLERLVSSEYGNDPILWQASRASGGSPGRDGTPPKVPVGLSLTPISNTVMALAWAPSIDLQTGVESYTVYRDGSVLRTTDSETTNILDETAVPFVAHTYEVTATNRNGLISERSEAVTILVIDSVFSRGTNQIQLVFSEAVDEASAETVAHYQFGGATIESATVEDDGRTVTLTTESTLVEGLTDSLIINDVISAAGARITPNTETFTGHTRINEALVLWLGLDAQSGSLAFDSSGNNHHGELINMTDEDWVAGHQGRGLELDGVNDYIITSDAFDDLFAEGNRDMTLSVWFSAEADGVVVSERGSTSLNELPHKSLVEVLPGGEVRASLPGLGSIRLGTMTIGDGQFHQAILRYNQTTRVLDGRLDGVSSGQTITGNRSAPSTGPTHYSLGAFDLNNLGGSGAQFKGRIDDLRIFNESLSDLQMEFLSEPDLVLPSVAEVSLSGSNWTSDFINYLQSRGLGSAGYGVPSGAAQAAALPWGNANHLSIRFSENVDVSSDQLTMIGVNRVQYNIEAFDYDAETFIATWTLDGPIPADKLLFELSDAVIDRVGNRLDGNWRSGESTFPSGDGVSETDDRFTFRFNMLPGDANGDGEVTKRDLVDTVFHLGTDVDSPGFDARFDFDGNGRVDTDDLRQVIFRLSTNLPADDLTPTGGGTATVAADTIFSRIGAADPPAAATTPVSSDVTPRGAARRAGRTATARPHAIAPDDATFARRRATSRGVSPQAVDVAIEDTELTGERPFFSARRARRGARRR